MPTYDYACEACDHTFEKFQPITAAPIRKCPQCGRLKVKRLIGTGAGVIFKGSGFYCTDYRSDAYRKSASADKPAGDSTSKSDSGSSDKSSKGSAETGTKGSADKTSGN